MLRILKVVASSEAGCAPLPGARSASPRCILVYYLLVLLSYLDEFGHIGPFVTAEHPRFNTHPAFGYAGFVIPDVNVREFAAYFEHLKQDLLAFEIKRDGAHPRRWEKKGASLLTSRNMEMYGDEIRRVLGRLARRLTRLGGRLVFFGEVKPQGSHAQTGDSPADRSARSLREAILQLSRFANARGEPIMIFMDALDEKPRLAAVMAAASYIYAAHVPELRRVVEIPMQLESHFYATTQYADWLCALLSRASHLHLVGGSKFGWAPALLADCFGSRERHLAESTITRGNTRMTMSELVRPQSWSHANRLLAGAHLIQLGGSDSNAESAPRRREAAES